MTDILVIDVLIMGEQLLELFVEKCNDRNHKYIITREEAKNVHYHCQLHLDSKIDSKEKLRKRIQSHMKTGHNLQFLKIKTDEQRHLSYILKEGVVVYNNLLDNDKLLEEIENAKQIHIDTLESRNNLTFTQKLVLNYTPMENMSMSLQIDIEEKIEHVLKYITESYNQNSKGYDQIMIDRWVNVIMSKYYSKEYVDNVLKTNYMKKYFLNK